jgi:general stress protein YciG
VSSAEAPAPKKLRGFAAMTPEQRAAICSKGGKAAHAQGKAHTFTSDEAKAAGKKGGATVASDRAHMAEIGRAGGKARGENLARTGTEVESEE